MKSQAASSSSIDKYIQSFPRNVQTMLAELRTAIHQAAPKAGERISYRMPAFWQNGYLVYFAAFAKHIGFYPTASGIQAFKKELSKYKSAKGSVQFPLNEPLPLKLIAKIVKFRVLENEKAGPKA